MKKRPGWPVFKKKYLVGKVQVSSFPSRRFKLLYFKSFEGVVVFVVKEFLALALFLLQISLERKIKFQ